MKNEVIRVPVEGKKNPVWHARKNGRLLGLVFPTQRLAFSFLSNTLTRRQVSKYVMAASPAEWAIQSAIYKTTDPLKIAELKAQLNAAFVERTGITAKTSTECKKILATALKAAATKAFEVQVV